VNVSGTSVQTDDRQPTQRLRGPALLLVTLLVQACLAVGPRSVTTGRSTYNAVINETEDRQILSMIVRHRYDETFGMLAVSGVTASLRVGASLGVNVGVGPRSGYEGNLVPLSADAVYEENPVISYVPMRGEQFVQRMLSPVTAEQALLLSRMSTDEVEVFRMLVRRANGLVNPLYSPEQGTEEAAAFERFIGLYARLRDRGELDIVQTSNGDFQLLIHDFEDDSREVSELLETVGVQGHRGDDAVVTIPLRFFVGAARGDGLDLETPSALEVIEAAGAGVAVPDDHRLDGLARSFEQKPAEFITIHSARERPPESSIAVAHRGWWFFIDPRDVRSKQAFLVLRTLIGLRLDEAVSDQDRPVLTVPIGG
jgi:hypothetical protein